MQCRHTVPDWHRYMDHSVEATPIFAACRLLLREGEPRRDPRLIACGYWGHQRECPLYDGPGATDATERMETTRAALDVPVGTEAIWPVRPPTERDGMRLVLLALGIVSIALLVWTAIVGFFVMRGTAAPVGFVVMALTTTAISILTHALATLRVWARR